MKTQKLLLTIAALAVLVVLPSSAKADGLTFTISNPIQNGAAGSLVTFNGILQNGPGAIIGIGFSDSIDPGLTLTNILFSFSELGSNAGYTGPLFEIMIDNSAMVGQVLDGRFTFTYLDSTGSEQETPAQDIVVTVVAGPAPIPEPTTLILMGTGLAGAAVARRCKRRKAGTA